MSGSPVEWARRNHHEELYQIGVHRVKAHLLRGEGKFLEEGEENTEIYRLVCKVLGKEPHLSNKT